MKNEAIDYRLADVAKDLAHFPLKTTDTSVIIDENPEHLEQRDLMTIYRAAWGHRLTAKLGVLTNEYGRKVICIEITE